MINLKSLIPENSFFVPRRSKEEREKMYIVAVNKQIQHYIKNGSVGDLDLHGASLVKLPDNLKRVGRDLELQYSDIKSLPAGLEIYGYLDLRHTPIAILPTGLNVCGDMYLSYSNIESLPSDLNAGDLYLSDTPLGRRYTVDQIRAMVPNAKGAIYI